MASDISILLSTYLSDNYIKKYYQNIIELTNVANIQLIQILNNPTNLELKYRQKFIELQTNLKSTTFKYDHQIVERESLYASWNRAIKLSRSRLITISNVDDIRYPEGLKAQISALKNCNDMHLLGSYCHIKTKVGLKKNIISKSANLVKADFFSGMYVGPFFVWTNPKHLNLDDFLFDEQFKVAGDFDFQIRFAALGSITILKKNVGEYLSINSGLSTGSILQSIEGQVIYHRYKVVDKILPFSSTFFFKNKYSPLNIKINNINYDLDYFFPELNLIKTVNSKRKKELIKFFKDFYIVFKLFIKKFILQRN